LEFELSSFHPIHKRLPVFPALKASAKKPLFRAAIGLLLALPLYGFNPILPHALANNAPAHFSDIPAASPALKYVEYLGERQIITGYPDNTFKPYKPVTRAEFAVMLAKSQNIKAKPSSTPFRDVSQNHWAGRAIQAVAQKGWLKGYPGGLFQPNRRINRAELYVVMAKVAMSQPHSANVANSQPFSKEAVEQVLQDYRDASQLPGWAKVPVAKAVGQGLLAEETPPHMLWPLVNANRSSVATVLAKLMNPDFVANAGQREPISAQENPLPGKPAQAIQNQKPTPQEAAGEQIRLQPYPEQKPHGPTAEQPPFAPNALASSSVNPQGQENASNLRPARSVRSIVEHPVGLYFSNLENMPQDPDTMLGNPSVRYFRGPAIAQQAIEAILQGPTEAERQRGFFVDDEICRLNLSSIRMLPDGKAAVTLEAPSDFEFRDPLSPHRLEAQIRLTLQQFPGVRQTELSILGANHSPLWTSP